MKNKLVASVTPEIKLLEGEELKLKLRPHVLAFYNLFLIWLFVIALSGLFFYFNEYLSDFVEEHTGLTGLLSPFTGATPEMLQSFTLFASLNSVMAMIFGFTLYGGNPGGLALLGVWFSIVMIAASTVSVIRISWRWVPILVGVLLASILLTFLFELPYEATYLFAIAFSIIGLIGVELFRRGHVFYITNFRVITSLKFFTEKENALSYDKINNVVMERPFLGVIFNFGTIMPITASGLGMGEDSAAVTVGGGTGVGEGGFVGVGVTGGQTVGVPRSRSAYALYGVPNPKQVYEIINKYMHEFVEAPYLQEMTPYMKEMLGEIKSMRKDMSKDPRDKKE